MIELVPVAAFWALAGWAFLSRGPMLLYVFFALMPFGSLAVVPTAVSGGLTITPGTALALLLAARTLGPPAGMRFALQAALSHRRLLLLALFLLVALLATLFMPRILAGLVEVVPVREIKYGAQPLQVTRQNLSQFAYLTLSVLTVFAFARLFRQPAMRQHLLAAIMLGAAIAILTGMLDLASHFVPLEPLLAPFRTASYSILADVEVLDQRRVIGLTPEASSYGGLVLGYLTALYFLAPAIESRALRRLVAPLVLTLVLFAYLSTSSAAYVGLAIFAALAGLQWGLRRIRTGGAIPRPKLAVEIGLGFGGAAAAVLLILTAPEVFDPVVRLFERMVLEKASSASFEERSYWTAVSWQALIDSGGLGVGVGSTRASSAPVAIFACTGLVGGLLYYAFVIQTLTRRPLPGREAAAMMSGIRWSFPVPFLLGTMIGTSANFGDMDAMRFGLALALSTDALGEIRRRPATPRSPQPPLPQIAGRPA
ncbi:MAG: hypothetical protein AAF371_19470 [Pseudomonadota bacterium]